MSDGMNVPRLIPRVLVGLLLSVIALAAARAQVFHPTTFTLANGLQVVVIENRRAPIVTHMVWYRAGAADEPPGKSGIAHFLEHLMFKGTERLAPGEFSRVVARQGGRDNAFTSWDYTGYVQTIARDRLGLVMEMEADRMVNLRLAEDIVATERDVILEERRQVVENVPSARLREQMNAAMFLNHPYGRPIIGWAHEIRALTRADALDWYKTWYAPNNAVLIVAGDVSAPEVRALAETHYGPIPARAVPVRSRLAEPEPEAARRVVLRDARVRQPSLTRAYLAPSLQRGESVHAYPLQVLGAVIGAQSGRIYRGLVLDRQLAVSAGAGYDPDAFDLTTFSFFASPRPGVDIHALEAALDAEIAALLRDGVDAADVERARSSLRDRAILARDSLGAAPRSIGTELMTGLTVDEGEAWPARIAAVTVAEVNAAARAVLQERRSVTGLLLPEARP
jgi:zinc protease